MADNGQQPPPGPLRRACLLSLAVSAWCSSATTRLVTFGRARKSVIRNCALLVIDVQVYNTVPGKGAFLDLHPTNVPDEYRYYFERIESRVLPNIARLQTAFRNAGAEVIYTVIEAATLNMRDLSLDYRISGIGVPKGSPLAKLPEIVAARDDEIIIPKTSSSVFMSTNIDYVLRTLDLGLGGMGTEVGRILKAQGDLCSRGRRGCLPTPFRRLRVCPEQA